MFIFEKVRNIKMKIWEKKLLYTMVIIGCIVVLAFCISGKLVEGARWSSGLPLGGVDNWLYENGSMYAVAEGDITPSSPYFPGLVLLSLVFRVIFGYGAETAIIITGGIVAVFTFWGFSIIASDDKKKRFWLAIIAALFFIIGFPSARKYLLEMHPDIPALMFFLWGIISLNKFLERRNKIYYCIATLLFWFAGLFKQNAVFLYLGLAVFVLLSKKLKLKEKIGVIVSEFIAGIATLIVVVLIDGCWYNCVTVNSLNPLLSIKEYLHYGFSACRNNKLFIVIALTYLVLLITRNIVQKRVIEQMWFAASVGWLAFCMYGAAKIGSNEGNTEATIIAVMPFVLISIDKLFTYIKEIIDINKLKADLAAVKAKKFIRMLVIAIFSVVYLAGILILVYKMDGRIKRYNERIELQNEFSEWLSDNYKGKNIAYDTITYELFNNAAINKTTDFFTASEWSMGNIIDDEDLYNISIDEEWDVIVAWPGLDDTKWPKTFSEFEKIDSSLYPDLSSYYGSPVEVYVRK